MNLTMPFFSDFFSSTTESLFPLNVIVWQIMRLRISRYWTTLFEIFQGSVVFFALLLARQSILPTEQLGSGATASSREYIILPTNKIYYSPHDSFTDTLMNNVVSELNNNPSYGMQSNILWELSDTIVLYDDDNPSNVFDDNIAIVHIKNPGEYSNNFTYQIKMFNKIVPSSKNERKFNRIFNRIQPPEEVANPLLGPVQWAIDKSYIRQHAGQNASDLNLHDKVKYIAKDLAKLHKFIILCTIIAPLPYFMYKSAGIIVARKSGLRDLLRLSGVSSNAFRAAHLADAAAMGTIYAVIITFFLKVTSKPILPYTNALVVVITIILYFFNVTVLTFIVSTLCWHNQHANSVAFLVYVCSFMFDSSWHSLSTITLNIRRALCCILPHAPIYMFWAEVTYTEYLGKGAIFSNLAKTHYSMSVLDTWLYSCIQLVVMLALDWYVDQVKPSRYGIPRKWDFMFKKSFVKTKKKKRVNFHVTAEYKTLVLRDQRYFEDGPTNAEIAVKVSNVSKEFKYKNGIRSALDGISLDIYRGEVTVLLGRTGSGKSVLMSIIAGLYAATKGSVYVNGLDNVQRVQDLLDIVAFCPQESIIHKRLTVRENIMMFEKLTKRGTSKTADELITQLRMTNKSNFYHTELSKGMLRSLQVACALVSDSDVLVLDEPTSGMDYEARHRLWDLIMDLRGDKTIIMTTSYLEEAEVLGDRIAIMTKGKLRCHGSPGFLKEALGGGFNLTITLKNDALMGNLFELVSNIIPGIKYKFHDKHTVSFILPMKEHGQFPQLFDAVEASGKYLTISAIDVGLIMEDIFLEFIDEVDEDDINFPSSHHVSELNADRLKGYNLLLHQFKVLVRRNFFYLWMKKYQFIIVQVLVPIIGVMIITMTTNRSYGFSKFFSVEEMGSKRASSDESYDYDHYRRHGLSGIMNFHKLHELDFTDAGKDLNKPHYLSDATNRAIGLLTFLNKSKIMITSNPLEVLKHINLYSNMYLDLHVPNNKIRITTTFQPITRLKSEVIRPKSWFLCIKWGICVAFMSIINLSPSILLSILERKTGSRETHIMAGCSPLVHWGSKLVAHFLVYMAVIPTSVAISALILDFDKTFSVIFLCAVLLLLILFALAFLAHLYFLSFVTYAGAAITHVFIMALGFGMNLFLLRGGILLRNSLPKTQ